MLDTKGGYVPACDADGQTSQPGVFAAGDVSGIEEASSAMIEGRISGIAMAAYLGFATQEEKESRKAELEAQLDTLRQGMFAPKNRGKNIQKTEEGIDISSNLLAHGFVADDEIERFPGVTKQRRIHPVIECTQNIPCNPCQDACRKGCIKIGSNITSLPVVDEEHPCIGCGMCVASCSGQAIFLIEEEVEPAMARSPCRMNFSRCQKSAITASHTAETARRSVPAKSQTFAPVPPLTTPICSPSKFQAKC